MANKTAFGSRLAILLTVLLLASASHARDVNGNYAVFGAGARPCTDYLGARDAGGELEELYLEWIAGHLSAYNLLLANTYNVFGTTEPFDMFARLDSYCRHNRDTLLVQALAVQIETMYETRSNISPDNSGWKDWLDDVRKGRSEADTPTETQTDSN